VRLLPAALLIACCGSPALRGPDRPGLPGDVDPTLPDADVELVVVGHERELRGVWLTTVWNIDYPKTSGADAQRAELIEVLDTLQQTGFNAVFFQVRPEGDAVYASTLEPWSRYLAGAQGRDPGWDPLDVLVTEAHARNLEVHAWLNPYRARVAWGAASAAPHLSVTHPDAVVRYGDQGWMDPGLPVVQDRLVAVIQDLADRYQIDGIHFDDYFYPYPIQGTPFPDDATYAAYQRAGGTLGRADWRRDNVNRMVERVHLALRDRDPTIRFGISPFGIYRPGQPPGITGLDSYEALYADPVRWSDEGWVDYLAPQLYWPTTQTRQAFEPLIGWWSDLGADRHHTFAGLYLSKLGDTSAWTLDEFEAQVALSRARRAEGSRGNIWFSYAPLRVDRQGVRAFLRERVYPAPALTPAFGPDPGPVAWPSVQIDGTTVTAAHADRPRALAVYEPDGDVWALRALLPGPTATIALEPGRWAISAVRRDGRESPGVVVTVGP
jgi:uncharacterized lipoprotein YddW (UPF0748 family)